MKIIKHIEYNRSRKEIIVVYYDNISNPNQREEEVNTLQLSHVYKSLTLHGKLLLAS